MKLIPFLIIVVALAFFVGQKQTASHLAEREKELLARQSELQGGTPRGGRARPTGAAQPTKAERPEVPKFDAANYTKKYRRIIQMIFLRREPSEKDIDFLYKDLLAASSQDLLGLPAYLKDAKIPDDFLPAVYEAVSDRLLDKDPALAAEFAVKGSVITNFLFVIRSWIARDPIAAGEWLAMKSQADPPLNEKTFHALASHLEPLDVPGLQLTAGIAAAPANADLSGLLDLEGPKLKAMLEDIATVLPAEGLPPLLKRLSDSGRPDLIDAMLQRYPDPTLARESLANASLPPEEFVKAAASLVSSLDPAGMPRGMDWFLRNTDPAARSESLREIVASWTNQNPRSAATWIETLPSGEVRDIAEQAHATAKGSAKRKTAPDSR